MTLEKYRNGNEEIEIYIDDGHGCDPINDCDTSRPIPHGEQRASQVGHRADGRRRPPAARKPTPRRVARSCSPCTPTSTEASRSRSASGGQFSCPWDAGQCGIWIVEKDDDDVRLGKWDERQTARVHRWRAPHVRRLVQRERLRLDAVQDRDSATTGHEHLKQIDSCGGYVGNLEYVLKEAMADTDASRLVARLMRTDLAEPCDSMPVSES